MFVAVSGRVRKQFRGIGIAAPLETSMPWTFCVSSGVQNLAPPHPCRTRGMSGERQWCRSATISPTRKTTSSWSGICHQDARDRTQKSRGPENHRFARDRRRHEIKFFHAPSDRSLVCFLRISQCSSKFTERTARLRAQAAQLRTFHTKAHRPCA